MNTNKYSFAELEKSQSVTPGELKEALREYASGGWAVAPQVVLGLTNRLRTNLSADDFAHLRESVRIGRDIQEQRGEEKAASEYREILGRL